MPEPTTFDIFRLKIVGVLEAQTTVNVLYYVDGEIALGAANRQDQVALATAFTDVTGPMPEYLAACSNDWAATSLLIDVPTKPENAVYTHLLTGAGGGALVPPLPNQMAVTIQKHTTWRGKHGRGRISVPAVPSTWTDGTTLVNKTAHQALADVLNDPVTDATHTFMPVIMAEEKDEAGVVLKVGQVPIVSCSVNTILGTARRRKPGVGI